MVLRNPEEIQKKSSKTQHLDSMYEFKEIQKNSKEIQQNKKSRPNVCLTNPEEIQKKSRQEIQKKSSSTPGAQQDYSPIMLIPMQKTKRLYLWGKRKFPTVRPPSSHQEFTQELQTIHGLRTRQQRASVSEPVRELKTCNLLHSRHLLRSECFCPFCVNTQTGCK